MSYLDWALHYRSLGWAVLPCQPGGKAPLTTRGHHDATTDIAQIQAWWRQWPDANIGLALASSGLVAVDIDAYKPECTWETFAQKTPVPVTLAQRSARGGRHLLFQAPPQAGFAGHIDGVAGVDVKHEGYILVAPSVFAGGWYEWENSGPVSPAPTWMPRKTEKAAKDPRTLIGPLDRVAQALQDISNDDLSWDQWNRVGMATWAATQGDPAGFLLFNEWSARSSKHDDQTTLERWQSYTTSPPVRIGNGTLRFLADLERQKAQQGGRLWPAPLDLQAMALREPEKPQFIIPDWLPVGYAALLAGHGGAGKSYIGLHLAVCIALGLPWCGMEVQRRRVLILACEDRRDVLHWRLSRLCRYLGVDLASLSGWLTIHELVGQDTILWRLDTREGPVRTDAYGELKARLGEAQADVLMVDGIADVFAGSENDRAQVKDFVNSLLGLIPERRGAVLLLGHVNKPTASAAGTSEGYSGSTQWHNAVRARWYLRPDETTGGLTLELQKSNLGRADQQIAFGWDDENALFAGRRIDSEASARREEEERQAILQAMAACQREGNSVPAAMTGPRTAFHVLSATKFLPKSLSSRKFRERLEELRSMGKIQEGSTQRTSRHPVATLELKSAAFLECVNASNAENHIHTHTTH